MFRASAHHIIPRGPRPGSQSIWQVYTGKLIVMLSRGSLSDNNLQAYLFTFSLSYVFKIKWFEMRPSNQVLQVLFYCTGVNVLGFDSLFKYFYVLGNGAWKVSPSIQRCFQLKTIRSSQCTLAWYEDLIRFNRCDRFAYAWNTKCHETTRSAWSVLVTSFKKPCPKGRP